MSLVITRQHGRSRHAAGFTLVEVMVTVFIISVLTVIAYSAYMDSVMRTRRAAATGCLLEVAQFMERFRTTNLRYDLDQAGNPPPAPACSAGAEVTRYYTVEFAAAPTAGAFTLRAVPQGGQATRDTDCGTLTLDQIGTRDKSGTAAVADCW